MIWNPCQATSPCPTWRSFDCSAFTSSVRAASRSILRSLSIRALWSRSRCSRYSLIRCSSPTAQEVSTSTSAPWPRNRVSSGPGRWAGPGRPSTHAMATTSSSPESRTSGHAIATRLRTASASSCTLPAPASSEQPTANTRNGSAGKASPARHRPASTSIAQKANSIARTTRAPPPGVPTYCWSSRTQVARNRNTSAHWPGSRQWASTRRPGRPYRWPLSPASISASALAQANRVRNARSRAAV